MKILDILKSCLNPKVILVVIAIIALIYFFAPRFVGFSSVLLVLICPLSMVFMMMGMRHADRKPENNDNLKE